MDKKVALITGANKGIGFSTARQLGELGYRVLVGARDAGRGEAAVAALRADGIDAHVVVVDLGDAASVASAVAAVLAAHPRLDALVHNAAILDHENTILGIDLARHRREMEVNYFGAVALTDGLLPRLLEAPSGARLVFLTTPLATHANAEAPTNRYSHPDKVSYKVSKAALGLYAHNLAVYLAREAGGLAGAADARVNCAYPGYVRTDMCGNTAEAPLSPDEGAETSVYLATLPPDGPTGGFFYKKERLPW